MKIVLYGLTGNIEPVIAQEALNRGHEVTAVVRTPAKVEQTHDHLTVVQGDVTDAESIAAAVAGHDAVISSIGANFAEGNYSIYTEAAHALIAGIQVAGNTARLLIVGGAGSLEVAPGVDLVDTPQFPEAWRPLASAHRDGLRIYRTSDIDWTFVSPAIVIEAGERTGTYRVGGDQVLSDAKGESRISNEDYAVALIDELEHPAHRRERITVAY